MNQQEFYGWETASRDTIDFKKLYVDIASDLAAGLAHSGRIDCLDVGIGVAFELARTR